MSRVLRLAAQFAVIGALFASVAWLSDRPVYRQIPPGSGIMMLTFVHGANPWRRSPSWRGPVADRDRR